MPIRAPEGTSRARVACAARYSGATEAEVSCETAEDQVVLRFTDNGRPYDPTKQEEPDTPLSAEERSIGGLGIPLSL